LRLQRITWGLCWLIYTLRCPRWRLVDLLLH
jgi:hypothetical protein